MLYVDSNSFEAKGAESIVDALEANATLTALRYLNSNIIICRIVLVIYPQFVLLTLSLSLDGNNLGGEIAKHLSRSLTHNCTLTALS